MRYKDLQDKSEKELMSMIAEERAKLHALNLKSSMNQLKDVREIREIRKGIARMMTRVNAMKAKA